MDPAAARLYEIGGHDGERHHPVDVNAVMLFSGLKVGEKVLVPGPRIAEAIKNHLGPEALQRCAGGGRGDTAARSS
jgi:hypothetical protein